MRKASVAVGMFALCAFVTAAAQRIGAVVTIDQTQSRDLYVAGRIVRVSAEIDGDLVTAGQRIVVDGVIGGDLLAAGETVEVRDSIRDDARIAGRTVAIESTVAGHVVAAGDDVEIRSGASIADWAWIAGRTIDVSGRVTGELRAAGQRVVLSGNVGGDAVITAGEVEIDATSVIGGDLIVQSESEPVIADGATVQGEIIVEDLPEGFMGMRRFDALRGIGSGVFFAVVMIVTAIAFLIVFPGFSGGVTERARSAPLQTLGIGLGTAVLTPIAIFLLFATGIGFLIGLGALAAYLLLLLLGVSFGLIGVGKLGLMLTNEARARRIAIQMLAVAIGVIVVLLLGRIPVLGAIILLVVGIGGVGAVVEESWGRYRSAPRPSPP